MEMSISVRKRTVWIWIISIFFLVSSLWGLWSYYLIASGKAPIEDLKSPYFANLTILDYAFLVLIQLANLCGAITLFLMRRAAFYLFMTGLIASIMLTIRAAIKGSFQNSNPVAMAVGMTIGFGIAIVVCMYTWKLLKRGTLN